MPVCRMLNRTGVDHKIPTTARSASDPCPPLVRYTCNHSGECEVSASRKGRCPGRAELFAPTLHVFRAVAAYSWRPGWRRSLTVSLFFGLPLSFCG